MKKIFQDAEVKLIRLSVMDILTSSTDDVGEGNGTVIGGNDDIFG